MGKAKSIAEMIEALAHYYEAAGFEDVYNKELKDKNEDEIRKMYSEIINIPQSDI